MNTFKVISENEELHSILKNLLDNIENIKADIDIYSTFVDEKLYTKTV